MAVLIRMPAVLTGITEAAIQTWLVAPGEQVSVGTPIAEIETEKAVVEYAAESAGTVLRILVPSGESVAIGAPIAVVGAPGESVDDVEHDPAPPTHRPAASGADTAIEATPIDEPAAPADADAAGNGSASPRGDRRFASPLVRRLARERKLDLSNVKGTGPNGRIVRRDLDALPPAAADAATAPLGARIDAVGAVEDLPLTAMRRAIARRLTESTSTVPHFFVTADCRVDRLVELRAEVNAAQGVKVSLNDFVLKAVAGALRDVPEANSTWGDTVIHRHSSVDIAVAVAIDGGLVTPVLHDVDRLPLTVIASSVIDLAQRARAGHLKQHELEGGAFSVSNLGMFGTKEFTAIINPPHAGILAVGAARPAPVVDDGRLVVGTVMTVTLSADHRVLDGALAAQWMAAFQRRIEQPLSMLV